MLQFEITQYWEWVLIYLQHDRESYTMLIILIFGIFISFKVILAFKVQDNSKFICLTFVYYITCIRLHDSCTTVDWLEWFKLNRTLFNVKLRTEERFYFSFYNNVQAFCVMLLKMHRNNCYCYNIKLKDRTRKPSHLFGCFSFWLKILNTHGRWKDSRIQ